MTPLEQITERVMRHGHPEDREVATPLLTLEEFSKAMILQARSAAI